jgi:hypothetical protein
MPGWCTRTGTRSCWRTPASCCAAPRRGRPTIYTGICASLRRSCAPRPRRWITPGTVDPSTISRRASGDRLADVGGQGVQAACRQPMPRSAAAPRSRPHAQAPTRKYAMTSPGSRQRIAAPGDPGCFLLPRLLLLLLLRPLGGPPLLARRRLASGQVIAARRHRRVPRVPGHGPPGCVQLLRNSATSTVSVAICPPCSAISAACSRSGHHADLPPTATRSQHEIIPGTALATAGTPIPRRNRDLGNKDSASLKARTNRRT